MNKAINSIAIALAVIAVLSFGMTSFAQAQNATNYGRHDFGRDHFGLGLHVGVPIVRGATTVLGATVANPTVATTVVNPTVTRFHDFAFAHHEHFIILNGQSVYLPETVACPPGSSLVGVQCVVNNQVLIQQAAPSIIQEQVQTAPTETESTVVTGQTSVIGSPIVTCPQGNLVNGQCVIETQQQQVIAPNVSCAVGTLVNGQCVEQQQQITVSPTCGCPEGSITSGSQCIVNALPSQVTTGSVAGEIIIAGHHFHHEGVLPFLR